MAEDRGFEPLRAVNPTRFPSERHRPLGESSAEEATGRRRAGEIAAVVWPRQRSSACWGTRPGVRLVGREPLTYTRPQPPMWRHHRRTPPGPEGSKGRRALPGTWGAFSCPRRFPGRPGNPEHGVPCNARQVQRTRAKYGAPYGCRRGWLGFRGGVTPRAVPALPAGDLHGGHRPGPRDRAAARGAGRQPGEPRLPLLRAARLRQDHQRADPGPGAQLRAGAGGRPVRRVRLLPRPRARRAGQRST